MPAQWDAIGSKYDQMKRLPVNEIQEFTVTETLGDLSGQRILDLACGNGHSTRGLHKRGASYVCGIDVSSEMVRLAREVYSDDATVEFHVGDCGEPRIYETKGGKKGGFDMVYAAWLLHYAPDEKTLLAMWQNIYMNLKPGGRFAGICPNLDLDCSEPVTNTYGMTTIVTEEIEHGHVGETYVHTKPPFTMRHYRLDPKLYEKCAAEAGMTDFQWVRPTVPDDERRDSGFWDEHMKAPHMTMVVAYRPA